MSILTARAHQANQAPAAALVRAAPNTNWLQTIRDPQNANLDIVAVHGMNTIGSDSHPEDTWTEKESGTHWLKDLLPDILPRARILSYQYNANVVFGASAAGIDEQARNLLHCLHSERSGPQAVRPIIFIAHSMGGILVKETLATAFHDSQCYSMLWVFTYCIVFFAVPHKGSKHASWGRIVAQSVQVFTGQLNESFLGSVEEASSYNNRLSQRFAPLLDAFKFLSICETLPERVSVDVGLIVQLESSSLGLPDSQELRLYPNRTHRMICKFASRSEPEWEQFSRILGRAATHAASYTSYSPTMDIRQMSAAQPDNEETLASPHSAQKAISKAEVTVARGKRLFDELDAEEDQIRVGVMDVVSWLWPILVRVLTFLFVPALFLPRIDTIMDNAEHARQSQDRLVEFQTEATNILDAQRASVLLAIYELRPHLVHGNSLPNEHALRIEHDLSLQAVRIISELGRRYRVIPEEKRRLRMIEDGQREAQGMDNRQLLEMIGRRAQEERVRQAAAPIGEARAEPCPCVIL